MRLPLEVTYRGLDASAAMDALIREQAERLRRFHRHLIACRVTLETTHKNGEADAISYRVRVELSLPGDPIIASHDRSHHQPNFDPYAAIRQAFGVAERQLKSRTGRRKSRRRHSQGAPIARVDRLFADLGYGFLQTMDGQHIYFHENSVVDVAFEDLNTGDSVHYEMTQGEDGPQATTVRPASTMPPHPRGF